MMLLLTDGQMRDHKGAAVMLPAMPAARELVADRGYDSNRFRAALSHLPGEEVWLIGEWRSSGERKYYLSNLPPGTSLRRLAASIKARWVCEQAHQQLKQELGLGAFEGRSWTGLHRRALMSCIAFAYLQHLRLRAAARGKKEPAPDSSSEAGAS